MVRDDPLGLGEHCRMVMSMARSPKAYLGLRYFDIASATGSPSAVWSPFQVHVCNNTSIFQFYNKSRQIGFSFIMAGDAVFDGMLQGRHNTITISYNLDEAREKIRYAKQWWESRVPNPEMIPTPGEYDAQGNWQGESPNRIKMWPELVTENALELEWSNGFRFMSLPCKPPRGKQATVILDEFAHAQGARAIYTAAVPMITRGLETGKNRIIIGSTPLGATGVFHDIGTNIKDYPDFTRDEFGWWQLFELCHDPVGAERYYREHGADETVLDEMVVKFGTKYMQKLRANILFEDFAQEYCLQFLDESEAFLSLDLIKNCYPTEYETVGESSDFDLDENPEGVAKIAEQEYEDAYLNVVARGVDQAYDAIDQLSKWIEEERIAGPFIWAYDVGRTRDASEIVIFQKAGRRAMQRAIITLRAVPFADQKAIIRKMLRQLPITKGWIDRGGIGMDLAEHFETSYGMRAMGMTFTSDRKDMWATNMKIAMQHGRVVFIPNRDQETQLHSIRRVISTDKMRYEIEDDTVEDGAGKKRKHHADKFWANAMAIYLACPIQTGAGVPQTDGQGSKSEKAKSEVAQKGFKTKTDRASRLTRRVYDRMKR